MTIQDISILIHFVLDEHKPGLILVPEEFSRILHVAQIKRLKQIMGFPENYAPGQWEVARQISDDLAPFKVIMGGDNSPLHVIDGTATLPTDLYYISTVSYKYVKSDSYDWKEVEILTDKEFNKRISSHYKRPSLKFPVCNIQNGTLRFSPETIKYADMVYLKTPDYPTYAVKITNGFQEFDAANSTVWAWNDVNTLAIISIFLNELNITINPSELKQPKQ